MRMPRCCPQQAAFNPPHTGAGFVVPRERPLLAGVDLPSYSFNAIWAKTPLDDSAYNGAPPASSWPAPRCTAALLVQLSLKTLLPSLRLTTNRPRRSRHARGAGQASAHPDGAAHYRGRGSGAAGERGCRCVRGAACCCGGSVHGRGNQRQAALHSTPLPPFLPHPLTQRRLARALHPAVPHHAQARPAADHRAHPSGAAAAAAGGPGQWHGAGGGWRREHAGAAEPASAAAATSGSSRGRS